MSAKKKARINTGITYSEVRLVDVDGSQVGIVTVEEALEKAKLARLDLVEVSPNAEPPVCRIMDYGKFVFEQRKRTAAARKKQRQIQIKEVKIRPGTEEADYLVKMRKAKRFIENGDKVKFTMRFRGREILHQDIGMQMFDRLLEDLGEIASVEHRPKLDGRQMIMILGPKKAN